jgi:membrane dipeptidase
MKIKFIFVFSLFVTITKAQSYQKIHNKAILVDTHNDFLTKTMQYGFVLDADLKDKTHSDLTRYKKEVWIFSFSQFGAMESNKIHLHLPIFK